MVIKSRPTPNCFRYWLINKSQDPTWIQGLRDCKMDRTLEISGLKMWWKNTFLATQGKESESTWLVTTGHFQQLKFFFKLPIRFYNRTKCDQLHTNICPRLQCPLPSSYALPLPYCFSLSPPLALPSLPHPEVGARGFHTGNCLDVYTAVGEF